jgi:hypothetical protein
MGKILRRVLRDEIPAIARVPRVQAFASSGRLLTCAKEAAGNRVGPAGTNIGTAPLPGALSEAAPCSGVTLPTARDVWPAWSTHLAQAKRCPSGRINWRGQPIISSRERPPLIGTWSAGQRAPRGCASRLTGQPRGLSL